MPDDATNSFPPNGTRSHTPGTDADRTTDFSPPPPAANLPADRSVIPGYDLLGILGRGAMGVVYEARQLSLDRVIALKMLTRSPVADPVAVTRFFAEAQIVATVKHPNVVEVYDFGEQAGSPYLAMELLGGGTLADRLQPGSPLLPRDAANLIETIARGVAAAHAQDIVHRDLKPGNVLFTAGGTPKVADFGLAKRTASDLTASQAIMGTPSYMAPEQAAGRGKFVGPPADVWALGVMLYELLAGRRPFESADTMDLLTKIIRDEPPKLRAVTKGLPRDLDVIVQKCLSKEPTDRYATAADLADDLTRFHKGEPIRAKAAGVVERAYKWSRRKPTAAAAWAMGSLAALLLAVAFVLLRDNGIQAQLRSDAEAARTTAVDARANAEQAQQRAEVAEGIAKQSKENVADQRERLAYARNVYFAHQAFQINNCQRANMFLELCPAELRGWDWNYVHRLCHLDLLSFEGDTPNDSSVAFSPDGLRILGSYGDEVWTWDAKTGAALIKFKEHTKAIYSVALRPC
ncbi:serine/threonine-protein kinase [Limnoglobus roseus]|uniref:non-specific serine/threonine protein kinase n=1 Tax=Limnoglobus roseus TaxID=2598579 RepID=A0A5C1A6I5_9BACT|nr:serine/threonine-protein kinase [Limnoglobus roseus]QEL13452.1 serine/threonine protein kinase [Limnoglobus roseus]